MKALNNKTKAFTLVELLVVISIIALLLSILLPSLQKARDSAMKVVCGSNLKQIGIGFNLYTQDFKDRLPPPIQGDEGWIDAAGGKNMNTWDRVIEPYLSAVLKNKGEGGERDKIDVFGCKSDKFIRIAQQETTGLIDVRRKRSYSMLAWKGPFSTYYNQARRMTQAKQPSQRFLATEWFAYSNVRWRNYHSFISQGLYGGGYRVFDPVGYTSPAPFKGNYHGKGSNFLYLDFHVTWMPAQEAFDSKCWGWDTTFPVISESGNDGFEY